MVFLDKAARLAAGSLWGKDFEVNVVFVSNQKIRAMNRRYLSDDRSTDVIAFPAPGHPGSLFLCGDCKSVFRGDVAISSDKAFQNARVFGTSLNEELARYVTHGFLHLDGYEDTSPRKKKEMKKREDSIVGEIRKIR
jgi:probable rRNA maturation factor